MTTKKTILAALLLTGGLGCHATTLIGGTDAGTCGVTFPKSGFYGPNILAPGNDSFVSSPGFSETTHYELVVQHDATESVMVNMTLLTAGAVWFIDGQANDWRVSVWDGGVGGTQTFEAPSVTGEFEQTITFSNNGEARLDIFECAAANPTVSKTITWSVPDGQVPTTDAHPSDDAARDGGPPSIGPWFPNDGAIPSDGPAPPPANP
jgi:hypothetical protein